MIRLTTWNGIPYAAPPIGDLRWRAPVPIREHLPPTTNGSIYDATRTPKTCVQGNPGWPPPVTFPATSSEDCLYLSIVAPTQPRAKKLPIVAYIHGGAYITGNGEIPPFFASFMNGNAVFVSMQYRLGLFGFLGSSDVKADGTANAGLLDQRLALEWIKAHADSFGGDPNHIVLFGGSAGGSSVMSQLAFRGGEDDPPFHGALAGTEIERHVVPLKIANRYQNTPRGHHSTPKPISTYSRISSRVQQVATRCSAFAVCLKLS